MNNRKARLLLQVPAASVGMISTYNISNTRRLFILGDLRGVVKRGLRPFSPTGRRLTPFNPAMHNLQHATGKDLERLHRLFATMPRYDGGIVYAKGI